MLQKFFNFIFSFFNPQKPDSKEDGATNSDDINLVAENHCEVLICKTCGKEYYSSGKKDPGICKSCLAMENFIGGPLGK